MWRGCFRVSLVVGSFFLTPLAGVAQEVVHALCGTVRSIDPRAKRIAVVTNDGTEGIFKEFTETFASLDFDKRIRGQATAVDAFKKSGDRVIVYYIGGADERTAVALQDLGAGPFEESSGTVVKFDRHEHVLTLRNSSGTEASFRLSPQTVAETPYGVAEGLELDAKDGEHLQVTASSVKGSETAVFIRAI